MLQPALSQPASSTLQQRLKLAAGGAELKVSRPHAASKPPCQSSPVLARSFGRSGSLPVDSSEAEVAAGGGGSPMKVTGNRIPVTTEMGANYPPPIESGTVLFGPSSQSSVPERR